MPKRIFAASTATTMLNLIVQFSISFFLTSYIVEVLGEEEYGFFTLANNIVNYALIITTALNSMSSRFIGYELHNGRKENARKYYSSVLCGDVVFSLLLIISSCSSRILKTRFAQMKALCNSDITDDISLNGFVY